MILGPTVASLLRENSHKSNNQDHLLREAEADHYR